MHKTRFSMITLCVLLAFAPQISRAQAISGFSTMTSLIATICSSHSCRNLSNATAYSETDEDYTAALYYNVANASVIYGPDGAPVTSGSTAIGNGTVNGYVNYDVASTTAANDGLYQEVTGHYVDFFYVAASGGYYDPYGFSTTGPIEGNSDSGYWLNVYVGLYIVEAEALIGETLDLTNVNEGEGSSPIQANYPRIYSVLYQAFIPPEAVFGPPDHFSCPDPRQVYGGDNRSYNTSLGSYRGFQQVRLGLGVTSPPTAPGFQDTGITHQYSYDSMAGDGVSLTPAARADNALGDCTLLEAVGKASTSTMTAPLPSYSGGVAATSFVADIGNPLEPAPAISWNANVTISPPSNGVVHVGGTIVHDCYPAHEISVGQNDVYSYLPPSNDFLTISSCLAGLGAINLPISHDILVPSF